MRAFVAALLLSAGLAAVVVGGFAAVIALYYAGLFSSTGEPDMRIGLGGLAVAAVGAVLVWRGGLLLKGQHRSTQFLAMASTFLALGLSAWWFLGTK